jgi:hypothetical protein
VNADTVTARFETADVARAVTGNLVLAVGARTGLGVDRLDELAMAADLVLARASRVTVGLTAGDAWLEVVVQPADARWVGENRGLLESLVGEIAETEDGGVVLRAG